MILLGVAVAGLVTAFLCPLVIRTLTDRAVIDTPGARSSHTRPTPRGGGIAPAVGAVIGALVASVSTNSTLVVIAAAAVAFGLLGLVDDVVQLSARQRLPVQLAIAGLAAVPLAWLVTHAVVVVLVVPAVCVWLVAFVNAFNFMDGINGISAVQAILAGTAWAAISDWGHPQAVVAAGTIIAIAAAAFLPYNFPVARVFLGDVGSYFFGAWLAAAALVVWTTESTFEMAVAPLLLYLCDTGYTLSRRLAGGAPITQAHREHVYQRLVIGGWSHRRTTLYVAILIAVQCVLGAVTTLGSTFLRIVADVGLGLVLLVYLFTPTLQHRFNRRGDSQDAGG